MSPEYYHIVVRFGHHAGPSGYHRLSEFIPDARVFEDRLALRRIASREDRPSLKSRLWLRLEDILRPAEIKSILHMIIDPGKVFHFLYAENSYRYSGSARFGNSRLVCTFHQPHDWFQTKWKQRATDLIRQAYRRIDRAVALGPSQVDSLTEIIGTGKVTVIPHGIDTEFFSGNGTPQEYPCILTVGSWLRNYALVAEVAKRFARVNPKAGFVVVANDRALDGISFPANVRVLQGLSDLELRELYGRAWLLYLPLSGSVANNALLEGLASGLPVVASDIGDVAYYLGPNGGCLLPDDFPGTHVEVLQSLISDGQRRVSLGQAARARAEQLAWPEIAREYLALYRSLTT